MTTEDLEQIRKVIREELKAAQTVTIREDVLKKAFCDHNYKSLGKNEWECTKCGMTKYSN